MSIPRARKSSTNVLSHGNLQTLDENISPTAAGPSRRKATDTVPPTTADPSRPRTADDISPTATATSRRQIKDNRREAFSFHSEEQALDHARNMRKLQDEPYLHTDATSASWGILGQELTNSEAESMRNGQVSHFSRTSSTATLRARPSGGNRDEQVKERQDSKVVTAARKFSVAMRKMSDYFRTPILRRKTIG